jgi:putative pyruvate formate lyase activating enzyme
MFTKTALVLRVRPALKRYPSPLSLRYLPSARRDLHLAPPFLLDDYIPQYQLLSSIDASKKRSLAYAHLRECNLCPRLCGVNRYEKTGVCLIGSDVKVNTIAPHFGEGATVTAYVSACRVLTGHRALYTGPQWQW